jgi:hypothetical protein
MSALITARRKNTNLALKIKCLINNDLCVFYKKIPLSPKVDFRQTDTSVISATADRKKGKDVSPKCSL